MGDRVSPRCGIVAVGTELTIGQVQDTNSGYIAGVLYELGCVVESVRAIPDDRALMEAAFRESIARYDVTVVTGGLGPTSDDFTQEVLMGIFGGELREDAGQLSIIRDRLSSRGLAMTERNARQAFVPTTCEILRNARGTAPGMLFHRGDRLLFSLPGVPSEMRWLMAHAVRPRVEALPRSERLHETLYLYGIAESYLADRLVDWELEVRDMFSLAYLPGLDGIRLRLDSLESACASNRSALARAIDRLGRLLPREFLGVGEVSLAGVLRDRLLAHGITLATAESCTAGALASTLCAEEGISVSYLGGVVAYDARMKIDLLGVPEDLLMVHGAVSGEVAIAMARGVRVRLGAQYGLSTTGLLGPGGDGSDAEVGTVWIGISSESGDWAYSTRLRGARRMNRDRAVFEALNALRLRIEAWV